MALVSEIWSLSLFHGLLSAWTSDRLLLSDLLNLIFWNACCLSSLFLFSKFLAFESTSLEKDNATKNLDEFPCIVQAYLQLAQQYHPRYHITGMSVDLKHLKDIINQLIFT